MLRPDRLQEMLGPRWGPEVKDAVHAELQRRQKRKAQVLSVTIEIAGIAQAII